MGASDPDFDLGPPLVKLLQGAIVRLRGCDNFLSRNGTCCGGSICLVGKELGKCLPKILLVLYELLDCTFPIHFEERLVGGRQHRCRSFGDKRAEICYGGNMAEGAVVCNQVQWG